MLKRTFSALLVVVWFFVSLPAIAHEVVPAIYTINLQADGTYTIQSRLNMEALVAEIDPALSDTSESPNAALYDSLRELAPEDFAAQIEAFIPRWVEGIRLDFDGELSVPVFESASVPVAEDASVQRLSTVVLRGNIPRGAKDFTWQYDPFFGESAVRVGFSDDEAVQAQFLQPGELSKPFPLGDSLQPKSRSEVAAEYVGLGFTHILPKGADHILFVLGIFLFSLHLRPLLLQVTAFTVAHSITLGLSLYGYIALPASIVEPLIAVSIVYVAVENLITTELKPWRIYVVFAFGLLHGMGFAGVLTELGLPRSDFVTALIAFNVGVELGQLAVIAIAFLAVGVWFGKKPWYRQRIVIPGSLAIAAMGAWWTVERVFSLQ
ncbi:MAG: HupE/UreJ family protein [Gammaproteobacteria bacterium]|nr:HupE/UreJ family protein [Gammaproteobacteria bacterium]